MEIFAAVGKIMLPAKLAEQRNSESLRTWRSVGVLCCQLLTELSGLFGRKIQSLKKKSCPINNFSLFGVILICTTEENLKFKVLYVCDKIQPQIFQICDICLFLIGTFF